jgi:hypothetical protein
VRRGIATCLLALAAAAAAGAQPVRSEGTGTAPLSSAPGGAPRARALEAALSDAVLRVAAGLVGGTREPAAEAALREALGPNPGRFALSFRSLSEVEQAGAQASAGEITVTIEAQVDRPRVEAALRRAGLLAAPAAPPAADPPRRIVIEPLPAWPALAAVRRRLVELGAGRVQLERVEPERVVLAIEVERSAASLATALASSPPPGVSIRSTGDRDGAPRIRLESVAPLSGDVAPSIDTPAAKR